MICYLNRDISLATSGSGGCNIQDINVGIQDGIYVYNLGDIDGLIFSGDSRPDASLAVETIITNQPFYRIDATSINYTENYDDHSYTESLTASIVSVRNEIEELMQRAVHGRYLVAFKVIGNDNYKLVGWKEGLALDDVLSISPDNNSFSLTFSGRTTYPMMEADKSNFKLSEKVFEPIFEPLFEDGLVVCEDGWATAMYVVKVNAAGQALDEDNKLCEYSEKKQDAYKLSGASDGDYNIIGTFVGTDYFNGKSVRIYDSSLCSVSGTISVSPNTIVLNSSATTSAVTVTSAHDWRIVTFPSIVETSITNGAFGSTTVYIYGTYDCGQDIIVFKDIVTEQTTALIVRNDIITIDSPVIYPNGTTEVTLSPIVCGDYSGTTTSGTFVLNDDGTFTVSGISESDSEQVITVTLTAGTETKEVEIIINGINASRMARAISEWCEIE